MVAMPPEGSPPASSEVPSPAPPGTPEVQRQARYNHLVGRLRGRQITMEEATELFALMQAMLRASEVARRSAVQGAMMASAGTAPSVAHVVRAREGGSGASDDLFLLGLLAMGAGAGLLAAMARRMTEPPTSPPRNDKGTAARRDA